MKTRSSLSILSVFSVLILLVQNSALATGIITVNNLNVRPGSNLLFTLNGPVAGTQYDQIIATQSVTIDDANLVLTLGFTPISGTTFEIINNQASGPVSGTGFHGLPQGSIFAVSGDLFQISYQGGDGNDVVLTAQAPASVGDSGTTWMLLCASVAAMIALRRRLLLVG
jgi:hypothetical protein